MTQKNIIIIECLFYLCYYGVTGAAEVTPDRIGRQIQSVFYEKLLGGGRLLWPC